MELRAPDACRVTHRGPRTTPAHDTHEAVLGLAAMLPKLGTGAELRHAQPACLHCRPRNVEALQQARRLRMAHRQAHGQNKHDRSPGQDTHTREREAAGIERRGSRGRSAVAGRRSRHPPLRSPGRGGSGVHIAKQRWPTMSMTRRATSRIPVSQSVPPLRRGRRLPCAAMLTAFAISFGTACKRAEPPAPPPPDVLVTAAVQKDVPIYSEWVGTTVGFVNAQVMPRVQGYLLKQDYQDGAYVTADQLLFEIDDRPYKAALDQTLGDLAQQQATLKKNQLNVEKYKPLAGIAGIAPVQVGDLVTPSTVLTNVSKVDPMKVTFPITEREYLRYPDRIREHQERGRAKDEPELQLILVDGDTYPHPGRFYVANRQVDQQTGTILVQALFPNPDTVLRPGLYAKVRAPTETRRGAVVIPQRAVQEIQGVYQVAVVGTDDKIALRTVKPGEEVDGLWIVDAGLQPGERVVTEGLQKVKDGILVRQKPDTSVPSGSAPAVKG